MKTKDLKVPLSESDVRDLNIGDTVYFSGLFYTCRTLFQDRVVREGIIPPVDFKNINLMVHVGPVMKKEDNTWLPVSLDPTSSIRFEKFGPDIIPKLNVRAIIGKTTMGTDTLKTMKDYGCVHLTKVGIYGNILASRIKRIVEVHNLEELGKTEATWIMEADKFGPFIVDMDAHGNSYFDALKNSANLEIKKQLKNMGVQESFNYTEI